MFSPDSVTLATSGRSGPTQLWETATGKPVGVPLGPKEVTWSVVFSPDGGRLITGSDAGVEFWDRETGRLLHAWTSRTGLPNVFLYPNGNKALFVVSGLAQVWDVATRQVTGPPRFHSEGGIRGVAFSPDGQSVLISSGDHVARLWDVTTGKPLGPPVSPEATGWVAFSPGSRRLAASASDGRIVVWDPPLPREGTVERVRLEIEQLTGMELDAEGVIRPLSPEAVEQRSRALGRRAEALAVLGFLNARAVTGRTGLAEALAAHIRHDVSRIDP